MGERVPPAVPCFFFYAAFMLTATCFDPSVWVLPTLFAVCPDKRDIIMQVTRTNRGILHRVIQEEQRRESSVM
jgi:hypothetical protein